MSFSMPGSNPVWSWQQVAAASVAAVAVAALGGVGLTRAANGQSSGQSGPGFILRGPTQGQSNLPAFPGSPNRPMP